MQKGFFSKPLFFYEMVAAAFFYEGLSRTRKDRHIEDFMASGPIRNLLFSELGHSEQVFCRTSDDRYFQLALHLLMSTVHIASLYLLPLMLA